MTKILGILGSPRKNGNTHILMEKLFQGAREKGAETELIFLNELNIKQCDGCWACGEGKNCPKADDMNPIYSKIFECDAIILGTPIYWYNVTGIMKKFFDRFTYFTYSENKAKIKNKSVVTIIPYEEQSLKIAESAITMFEKSLKYLELNLVEQLIVPGVNQKGDVLQKVEVMEKAFDIGKKLLST